MGNPGRHHPDSAELWQAYRALLKAQERLEMAGMHVQVRAVRRAREEVAATLLEMGEYVREFTVQP